MRMCTLVCCTTLRVFHNNKIIAMTSLEDGFLTQYVTKPTRHRLGQNSSLLDLVFTSDPEMIDDSNINHLALLGGSDHEVLLWNIICYLN